MTSNVREHLGERKFTDDGIHIDEKSGMENCFENPFRIFSFVQFYTEHI